MGWDGMGWERIGGDKLCDLSLKGGKEKMTGWT